MGVDAEVEHCLTDLQEELQLRGAADLRVSVDKLRRAFGWSLTNSWPWMEATKHHTLWGADLLDGGLETFLHSYASGCGGCEGVPAELIEGASQIIPEHATVDTPGLADYTEDATGDAPWTGAGGPVDQAGEGTDCAAVIGLDEFATREKV